MPDQVIDVLGLAGTERIRVPLWGPDQRRGRGAGSTASDHVQAVGEDHPFELPNHERTYLDCCFALMHSGFCCAS